MAPPFVRSPSIPSAVGLVIANLVPLVGVVWFGWSLLGVMWLYWAENGVVGAFALARLLSTGDTPVWKALPMGLFFTIHFGGFWLGHGAFVWSMFGPAGTQAALPLAGVVPLAASHGASFVMNYLVGGEWRVATPMAEMFKPYGRVVVLHLAILLGGFFVQSAGADVAALVILVVGKAALDLGIHWAAHGRRYDQLAAEAPETPGRTLHLERPRGSGTSVPEARGGSARRPEAAATPSPARTAPTARG